MTILLAIALGAVFSVAPPRTDQCLVCHEGMGDRSAELFRRDVHFKKGLSCADCHGGHASSDDAERAMSKQAGFIGRPQADEVTAVCARCHSNSETMRQLRSNLRTGQAEALAASVHGRSSLSGKGRIAQCTTCHEAHGIVSPKDRSSPVHPLNVTRTCSRCHSDAALMRSYNPSLPVDQLEKYRTSVHGMRNKQGDAKVAECASCHGDHGIRAANDVRSAVYATNMPATCSKCHSDSAYMKEYRIPTDQFAKFSRSVHGLALLQKHDLAAPTCNDCHGNHGAAPPGVESLSKVCGTCHVLNAELFSASPHKKAFDDRRLPECETCHSNHEIAAATDRLLGVGPDAVCSRCHRENENRKGFLVALSMHRMIDSLEHEEKFAGMLLEEAEQKGMEVSEPKFKLRDARQARLQSRTTVHAFDEQKFREVVEKGLASALTVSEASQEAIDEFYFRRWGLGVSTLIITVLAVSLYLTVRRIERKQRDTIR